MSETILRVRGRDALLFGDGRPFAAEHGAQSARSLPLPLPGTLAGCLRTQLGSARQWDWNADGPRLALAVPVAGPLLLRGLEPHYPAPADAVVHRPDGGDLQVMRLRPAAPPAGAGCDLPHPALLPLRVEDDVKPARGFDFWPARWVERWLLGAEPDAAELNAPAGETQWPQYEPRIHLQIQPGTGTAQTGMLFGTAGLSFGEDWSLLARVGEGTGAEYAGLTHFGGERRLATVEEAASEAWPRSPAELETVLAGSRRVRLQLATPAAFAGGWKPGWLDAELEGCPPLPWGDPAPVRLRLAAAAVRRREPVSGWDLRPGSDHGPRPVRWLVPAGSVFFFEVVDGDAQELLRSGWLQPVSDGEDDRRDGYGLALWGVWEASGKDGGKS